MKTPDPRITAQLDEIVAWLKEPVAIDPDWLARMMAADASSRREVEAFFFLFDEKQPLAYTVRDGVARLPIQGPIAKKSDYRVTYGEIAAQVEKAAEDRRVRGIVLDVDSPGGVVSGMYETAATIKAAAAMKPLVAVANDHMASAAYGISSGAGKIYSNRYGSVGSIGVVLVHTDYSKMNERIGLKPTFIVGGRKKAQANPEEPLSDEARADLQKLVDANYADFAQLVATNRGLHISQVLRQEAGVFMPADAASHNLIDGVQSFDECAGALSAEAGRKSMSDPNISGTTTTTEPPKAEVVDLDAAREQARAEGRREAKEREQAIQKICTLARHPELAGKMIASDMSVDQVKDHLIELNAKQDEKIVISGAHGGSGGAPQRSLTDHMNQTLKARGMKPRPDALSAFVPSE